MDEQPLSLRSPALQSVPDEVELPALPGFVAHVGPTPASYIQASYLVGTRVITFQAPLPSLDGNTVAAAVAKLLAEIREAGAISAR